MPAISFTNVSKTFGATSVLADFTASVDDGDFLVLLGPSGCGKSTLLRMIAGLTDITSGEISFDGIAVNDWDVHRRDTAFVFQSYALYPQMTVSQNIAFPLLMEQFKGWHHLPLISSIQRRRLMNSPDIAERVGTIAAQLQLTKLLDRRPARLSGGQRQRVALARSLVRNPSIYLLDEPLSNLDATLRTQMRADIGALHRAVDKTFVYVTHDQVEAMTMATKIIVMNDGIIQQIGTPDEIYDQPANTFVATFVGAPPMNLIDGATILRHSGVVIAATLPPPDRLPHLLAGIRPEHLRLSVTSETGLPAEVEVIERIGAETLIGCRPFTDNEDARSTTRLFAKVQSAGDLRPGDRCFLEANAPTISWFDRDSGRSTLPAPPLPSRAGTAVSPLDTAGPVLVKRSGGIGS